MKNSIPVHYSSPDDPEGLYQPMKIARVWGLNFALGNVLKYIKRKGKKGGPESTLEDLKKARDYLQDEIDSLERETKT